jgi:hypothetical protein
MSYLFYTYLNIYRRATGTPIVTSIGKSEIFFTRNGVRLGRAFTGVREPELYPSVGLSKRNQQVTIW